MKELVLYVHGKGGSAAESEHFKPLFPASRVIGLDLRSAAPWEAGEEIRAAVIRLRDEYDSICLIANSIGAYFCMHAQIDEMIRKAFFISPIVEMERLILDMMRRAGVSEEELQAKGVIPAPPGEELSWDYLRWVRAHPIRWKTPTEILCGSKDCMTAPENMAAFAREQGAGLTVMENGEHWFHTPEQMRFLDAWLKSKTQEKR